MWCEGRVPLHSSACGCPGVPAPFAEQIFFPPDGLATLVENQFTADMWVDFRLSDLFR